jgi:hypothetical protein
MTIFAEFIEETDPFSHLFRVLTVPQAQLIYKTYTFFLKLALPTVNALEDPESGTDSPINSAIRLAISDFACHMKSFEIFGVETRGKIGFTHQKHCSLPMKICVTNPQKYSLSKKIHCSVTKNFPRIPKKLGEC